MSDKPQTHGWVKLMRSEEARELSGDAAALGLLAIIALRARWHDGFNVHGLKVGQAMIGDYANMALTRQEYRTRLDRLREWGFVATKSTNKGTVATITDTRVFDVFGNTANQPDNQPATSQQPASNQPATTNKEGKKDKKGETEPEIQSLPDPRFAPVTAGFAGAYEAEFGAKYLHTGGKDGTALKKLLSNLRPDDYPPEKIVRVATAAMKRSKEPFAKACKLAATVHGFCHAFNEIRAELNHGKQAAGEPRPQTPTPIEVAAWLSTITPLRALQAPAVVIHYERQNIFNGSAVTEILTESAPSGATGNEFGAVVLTLPLRGVNATSVVQPVVTREIEDVIDTDGLVPFLASLYGPLAVALADPAIGPDGVTITKINRALPDPSAMEYDPDQANDPDDPAQTKPVEYDDSLSRCLVQGSISEDMVRQFALKAQAQRITFSYTLDKGSGDSSGPGGADYEGVSDEQTATVDIMATNATTQAYTVLSNYTPAENPPTGLAASYLATLSALQWSGSVVLEEQTAGILASDAAMGAVLNIVGGNLAWLTMNAPIVREQVQVSIGRTTLTFGPSQHLTPQDLAARLQTTRPSVGGRQSTGAKETDSSTSRKTGTPSNANTISGSTKYPIHNATAVPGKASATKAREPFEVVDASDDDGTKVRVVKSLLANQPPSGFSDLDDPPYILDVSGSGIVYACLTFDKSTGVFTGRTLGFQEGGPDNIPEDYPDSGTYYTLIGEVSDNGDGTLACTNDQFGPIKAATYRRWFKYPKEYAFAWT